MEFKKGDRVELIKFPPDNEDRLDIGQKGTVKHDYYGGCIGVKWDGLASGHGEGNACWDVDEIFVKLISQTFVDGDRVECVKRFATNRDHVNVGHKGTVRTAGSMTTIVSWDNFEDGWQLNDDARTSCWNVMNEYLKKLDASIGYSPGSTLGTTIGTATGIYGKSVAGSIDSGISGGGGGGRISTLTGVSAYYDHTIKFVSPDSFLSHAASSYIPSSSVYHHDEPRYIGKPQKINTVIRNHRVDEFLLLNL